MARFSISGVIIYDDMESERVIIQEAKIILYEFGTDQLPV